MSTGTDVRLMFEENRNVIVQPKPDLADQGAPQVQGLKNDSDIEAKPEPIDLGRANLVGMSMNDSNSLAGLKVQPTRESSDMGYACSTAANLFGELLGSATKEVGLEPEPASRIAPPQPMQRPAFGFA